VLSGLDGTLGPKYQCLGRIQLSTLTLTAPEQLAALGLGKPPRVSYAIPLRPSSNRSRAGIVMAPTSSQSDMRIPTRPSYLTSWGGKFPRSPAKVTWPFFATRTVHEWDSWPVAGSPW
jgi:hypothetical protein